MPGRQIPLNPPIDLETPGVVAPRISSVPGFDYQKFSTPEDQKNPPEGEGQKDGK